MASLLNSSLPCISKLPVARWVDQALAARFIGIRMFLSAVVLAPGVSSAAETAYTTPQGIYVVKVAGTPQPANPARTYLGIQLLPKPRYVGLISKVNGHNLTPQNGNPALMADAERKCFVHVLTGGGRGFVSDITSFGTSDVVCTQDLTGWMAPGTQIRIRPHPHLADLFGATNKFGLGAGPDADNSDNVVVWDPDLQQERVYYFNSTRVRWEEKNIVADAGRAPFRFPYGFYVVRRSPGTLRISLSGEIGADAILLPVRPAANVFSLPINLSASLDNLVRATGDFSVISGPNAKRSDVLVFQESFTGIQRGPFYRLSRPNASGWREVGVNGNTAAIQPLDFLSTLILRREGAPGYVFVEGSLQPPAVPRPPLSPDPEPGELPLTGELTWPQTLPPGLTLFVEISTDLQSWTRYPSTDISNGQSFALPSGQGRAFYRLGVTL